MFVALFFESEKCTALAEYRASKLTLEKTQEFIESTNESLSVQDSLVNALIQANSAETAELQRLV